MHETLCCHLAHDIHLNFARYSTFANKTSEAKACPMDLNTFSTDPNPFHESLYILSCLDV